VGHNCEFIVDFHMEPGEDGDPIFCDKPASIKFARVWLCAEHYDAVESCDGCKSALTLPDLSGDPEIVP
jgi:hypothetical protein